MYILGWSGKNSSQINSICYVKIIRHLCNSNSGWFAVSFISCFDVIVEEIRVLRVGQGCIKCEIK